VTASLIVAVAAAAVAVGALVAALLVLQRVRARENMLERALEHGKAEFDAVVEREIAERAGELERTISRVRADSLSQLAEEERRIAEERRRDVAERERDATTRLSERLVTVQASVEQRLAEWTADADNLRDDFAEELKRLEARQRQLLAELEGRIGEDAEGVQATLDEQRQVVVKIRAELAHATQESAQQATAELEQHAAERRRALHELADRLRARERSLQELVEREGGEAAQRVQLAMVEIERRQIDQLQRIVNRETARYAEAASQQFDTTIRAAREESARRLARELDLAVERFAREAEGVLAERVNQVSDAAAQRVEERLARLRSALERQRDEALSSLEDRAQQVEVGLRERMHEIAADAEAERAVLDGRLQELTRRLDELTARI
jgi:murein hydrolase activator